MAKTNVRGTQIADGSDGVNLAIDVTGTLPIVNGGTGRTTVGTAGQALTSNGSALVFTDAPTVASSQRGVAHTLPLMQVGNSYGSQTGNAAEIYFDRLKARLQSRVWNNSAVAAARAGDVAAFLYGSVSCISQGDQANANMQVSRIGTYNPSARPGGVCVIDTATNDAGMDGTTASGGTTAKSRAGFTNSLDSVMRLLRASSVVDDTNVAFTYTGTWATLAGIPAARGGTLHYTTTAGDKVSYAWTGNDADLVVVGIDAAALGLTGAAFTLKLDGVTYPNPSGFSTTNDQHRITGGPVNSATNQLCIPVRGAGAGAHTLELTHAGSTGQVIYVDCALVPSATPQTLIVNKTPTLPTAGYATYTTLSGTTSNSTIFAIYDGLIDTVVARFPSDGSIVKWDPKTAGMDPNTMIGNYDGVSIHLNDLGNRFYAEAIGDIIEMLPSRVGLDGPPTVSLKSPQVQGTGISSIVQITQAAYTALGTKDSATLYVIVG